MGEKSLYRKLFLIFDQEDAGFGAGQSPSGYVKIEVRDGKGKLSAAVQNLKEDSKSIRYKLYILRCTGKDFSFVNAGVIPLNKNKGELQWEFVPENIDGLNNTIEDIDTVVVVAEYMDREKRGIVCPLAAYKGKKTAWRENFREKLYSERDHSTGDGGGDLQAGDAAGKIGRIHATEMNLHTPDFSSRPIPEPGYFKTGPEYPSSQDVERATEKEQMMTEGSQDVQKSETLSSNPEEYKDMAENEGGAYPFKNDGMQTPQGDTAYDYAADYNGAGSYDSSFTEKAYPDTDNSVIPGDVERLKKDLDRCFEICDPFSSRRRDYKWWKVNSPVHLNNVLYQCNIKTPVLFNPKILMSHFKYRHLIFGIYTDTVRNKEYVVFGVPGVYSIDDRPFKDICRWAQVEGNKPRYGAFGYWLVYIDPKTGKIV